MGTQQLTGMPMHAEGATSVAQLTPAPGRQPALRLVPGQRPTLDYVFETPLDEMTSELHVEVVTAPIRDAGFFGHVAIYGSRVVVALSPNLGEFETDFFIRYLTAQAYRLPMSPLPTPFEVERRPALEGVSA